MEIRHFNVQVNTGNYARAYATVAGTEYGFEQAYQWDYESAKRQAELKLLQFLERIKINARNPGEEANGEEASRS